MKKLFLPFILCILIFSCNDKSTGPDVSGIKVDIKLERFEKDFFAIDTNKISEGLTGLMTKYPGFYADFMQEMLGIGGDPSNPQDQLAIKGFYAAYKSFNDSLELKYKSTTAIEKEITKGLQHVKYYFPEFRVPGFITFLSTLDGPGTFTTPRYVGIGLQHYAGKNFGAYFDEPVQQIFPRYITRRFDEEFIASDCIKGIINELFPDKSNSKPLIEQMIEKGKRWYLLDKFIPDLPDSVKTGYTQKQLEWCNKNEGEVWSLILKNEDLNSINPEVIQTFIGEGPYTQGFSEEYSPGNLGQWFGWQIVKKYADKNSSLSPAEIMKTDARKILDEAKYKPR
jgi:hypothetical protein